MTTTTAAAAAAASTGVSRSAGVAARHTTPSDFLRGIIGKSVVVRLNSGAEYRGKLVCLDGYLNIVMEQTEEYTGSGELKQKYGDAFLRGNNVMYIGPAEAAAMADVRR